MIHISDKPHGLFISQFSNPSMHHSSCETWQVLFSHHVFLPQCFNCSQMLRPHTVQDFDVKWFCCLNMRWTAWKGIRKSTAIGFTCRLPFLEKPSFLDLTGKNSCWFDKVMQIHLVRFVNELFVLVWWTSSDQFIWFYQLNHLEIGQC